jgi:hypothetical protein
MESRCCEMFKLEIVEISNDRVFDVLYASE